MDKNSTSGSKSKSKNVASVERAFQIIEQIQADSVVGVTELSKRLEIPKSTVHRYCSTLSNLGYIVKRDNGYRLSLRFLDLGESARQEKLLYHTCREEIDQLVNEMGERAQVFMQEERYGTYIYRTSGDKTIKTDSRLGMQVYFHATAAGKAYLAYCDHDHIHNLIEETGMPRFTKNTICDKKELLEELEQIRKKNVAFNNEERKEGILAVGVPILSEKQSHPLGSISFTAPKYRMDDESYEKELPAKLKEIADIISVKTNHTQFLH